MTGAPLPIKYRDMRDEIDRCPWEDKEEAEMLLAMLDDEFLQLAALKVKE
jgi:hypothetical protein